MIELRDVIDLIWTEDTPIYIFTAEKEKFDYGESYIPPEVLKSTVTEISIYNDGMVEIVLGE
ncbi:hypothetical protein Si070_01694 [Streptococcus infantarius subsp. infantarius]|nr:hypothetical protein [Streptococcus infantarius subsp. infantarius]MCO4580024.1 hypothetical protein [Streptococcus infantarius subsp. infantarius]